jgi:hypothetical protein
MRYMKRLRRNIRNLFQDSECRGQDLNPRHLSRRPAYWTAMFFSYELFNAVAHVGNQNFLIYSFVGFRCRFNCISVREQFIDWSLNKVIYTCVVTFYDVGLCLPIALIPKIIQHPAKKRDGLQIVTNYNPSGFLAGPCIMLTQHIFLFRMICTKRLILSPSTSTVLSLSQRDNVFSEL